MRFLLLPFLLLPALTWADCADPVGTEGQMIYNADHNIAQLCNGTDWLAWGSGSDGSGWSRNGTATYYNAGNVGIGTDSPGYPLAVSVTQAGDTSIAVYNNSTADTAKARLLVRSDTVGADFQAFSSGNTGTFDGISKAGMVMLRSWSGSPATSFMIGNGSAVPIHFITDDHIAMTIDENQQVGIGTTEPAGALDVVGAASTAGWVVKATTKGYSNFSGIWSDASNNIEITARDHTGFQTVAMRSNGNSYLAGGNVGIGTKVPTYQLQVNGEVYATTLTESSDRRLKKDIQDLGYGLADVLKMRPVTFKWEKPQSKSLEGTQVGLIAQEVEEIVPEVVNTADDDMGTKSIEYTSLVPVAMKAIQELSAENDALKAEIGALRKRQSDYERHNMALEKRLEALEDKQ